MTQTGWMMWNAMINVIACGARAILYDGSPFFPSLKGFLKLISDQKYVVDSLGLGFGADGL